MTVDLLKHNQQLQNPGKPLQARGFVTRPPTAVGTSMWVCLIGWAQSQSYEVVGTNWAPRPNPNRDTATDSDWLPPLIPVLNSVCLAIFDHLGDCWVGSNWG